MPTSENLIETRLTKYPALIKKELKNFLPTQDFKLYRMIRYHLGFEDKEGNPREENFGKLIRPSLCLFACEATGGSWEEALPAACGIELIHNFSLVHDDIQDQDKERRHHPTVWHLWGVPQGINAGNALNTLSNLMISRLSGEIPNQKILTISRILNTHTLEMIEGQCMDIDFEDRLDITISEYMEMIEKKTAALIQASFEIGAILGHAKKEVVQKLGTVGELLGLAFQIRDDFLGIWGEGAKTGKPNSSDLVKQKKTLPIIFALQNGKDSRKEIIRIYQRNETSKEQLIRVRKLLEDVGAKSFIQEQANSLTGQALNEFKELNLPGWAVDDLEKLTRFLLARER